MSQFLHEVAPVLLTMVVGWLALWPARNRLGAFAYHIGALPMGVLAWTFVGVVSTLSGMSFSAWSTAAGAFLYAGLCWIIERLTRGPGQTPPSPTVLSFAIAGGSATVLGVALALARFTVSNNDSLMSYWPQSIALQRDGAFTASMMATRSVLIPSMQAGHVMFGSEWVYVIYTMLALSVSLWVVGLLLWGPLSDVSPKVRLGTAGGCAAFLALEPSFIFHSFFVHSHMISALFLVMSIGAMMIAARPSAADSTTRYNTAFLLIAGLSAAGLTLTRPDGLAYVFVPIIVVVSLLVDERAGLRETLAFFAPLIMVVFSAYGAAYAAVGIWPATKLSGITALAILAAIGVSAFGPWVVRQTARMLPRFRLDGERFLGVAVATGALLLLGVYLLKWDTAYLALSTAAKNLFGGSGGYGYLWYAVAGVLVLSVISGDALRRKSWSRPAFLATMLFFVLAGFVHGTSHPGRIGVGDSFNRVAFQALPLIVVYVGAVLARIMATWGSLEQSVGSD